MTVGDLILITVVGAGCVAYCFALLWYTLTRDGQVDNATVELLPDLYAGELASMGRLLDSMSKTLSRHALRSQDLMKVVKDASDELRSMAALAEDQETVNRLLNLSRGLAKALDNVTSS